MTANSQVLMADSGQLTADYTEKPMVLMEVR